MKKILALMLALVLALSLTVSAFAAAPTSKGGLDKSDVTMPNPPAAIQSGDIKIVVTSAENADYRGNIVSQYGDFGAALKTSIAYYVNEYVKSHSELTPAEMQAAIDAYAQKVENDVYAVNDTATARQVAKNVGVTNYDNLTPMTVIDISLLATGVAVIGDDTIRANTTIDMNLSSVTGGVDRRVVILHYLMLDGSWEKVYDAKTVNNFASFQTNSLSPFLIMVEDTNGGGSSDVVTNPPTADTTPIVLLVSLAVVSVLGCAYCIKRSRA